MSDSLLRVPAQAEGCWTVEHVLGDCEDFEVHTSDRHVGYVEEVRYGRDGEPETLVVNVGTLRRRTIEIPVSAIAGIDATHARLALTQALSF
jgi:hypothetical protein